MVTMWRVVGLLGFLIHCVSTELFTDESNARLPRLFHLDDFERCVSQPDGLYCLGVFELSPIQHSPTFQYIQEYSSKPSAFNRTLLHRGYCVSSRCPTRERNATLRFERCVRDRARRHANLSARIIELQHCTTRRQQAEKAAAPPDAQQKLFLQVITAILVLNIIGTVYDVATGDGGKKNGALMAWSIRVNWRRLTYDGSDSQSSELDTIYGMRSMATLMVLYAHNCTQHFQYYVTNPQYLENFTIRPDGVLLSNGTSLVQVFTMVSSFLTAHSVLLYSKTHKLSLTMLPYIIIKRVVRVAPVNLLLIGFTATWWPRLFTGPFQWKAEETSAICRRKFWSHVFFYNNMVDKQNQCLMPTWYVPVDMHLYTLACVLLVVLQRRREQARYLACAAFFASSVGCGVIAYFTGWQAMIYAAEPEKIRGLFKNVESFGEFYTSSWGSLPACFLGLYLAYVYHDLMNNSYNFSANKKLRLVQHLMLPLMVSWLIKLGSFVRNYKQPLVTAAYVTIDRPSYVALMFIGILLCFKIEGRWQYFFKWRGWRIPARLSFSVMLCHWLVNDLIVARPYAYHTSLFYMSLDYVAMVVYSFIIAIPIALLVEFPVQRFATQFL